MSLIDTLSVASSGLSAQRVRLQTVSSNIANAESVDAQGNPYQRKVVNLSSQSADPFGDALSQAIQHVSIDGVESREDFIEVLDWNSPFRDENGMVRKPNINPMTEMVDMMSASRSYEANSTVIDATRDLVNRAISLGRS
ncbi:MAG: flagellar basal-body rod protein FlgC [Cognaticolwellia sp.]|jgi:flagellar basal-body rod protein FlgC